MLLVLQRGGRTTALALAERLEVSQRTILRDVEALGEAGVPIVASRGSKGGIELLHGFQTHLNGLTADEAACLYLVGQPLVADQLGLGVATRSARHKLLNALPDALGEEAERLETWFFNDPDPGNQISKEVLRRIVECVRQHREIEITLGDGPAQRVRPLGLVMRAGSWNLAISGTDGTDFVCIDDVRATRRTSHTFLPPANFDLQDAWRRRRARGIAAR